MMSPSPRPLHIAIIGGFFLPIPPLAGGSTEKSWYRLGREFVARGHSVTMISRRWAGLPDRELTDGIQHVRVRGDDHTASLKRNLWLDLRWSLRVHRVLPQVDIVGEPAAYAMAVRNSEAKVRCTHLQQKVLRLAAP